jgi:hypothetical protein
MTLVSHQRVVLLESDLLLMTVEFPRSQDAAARLLVAPFFDSRLVGVR